MTNKPTVGRHLGNLEDMVIAACVLEMARDRGPGKTICPSEVARRLDPEDWQTLMPRVRAAAAKLADAQKVRVTQGGIEVDAVTASGPIRIGVLYEG